MTKALMAAASRYDDQRFLSKSELRIYKNKLRRQRIVRRQKLALALIIAVLISLAIFIAQTLRLDAQTDEYRPEYKYYRTVTVHCGDTLWDLAKENISYSHYKNIDEYISEICAINNILGDDIVAGEDIVIPYFSTEYK